MLNVYNTNTRKHTHANNTLRLFWFITMILYHRSLFRERCSDSGHLDRENDTRTNYHEILLLLFFCCWLSLLLVLFECRTFFWFFGALKSRMAKQNVPQMKIRQSQENENEIKLNGMMEKKIWETETAAATATEAKTNSFT